MKDATGVASLSSHESEGLPEREVHEKKRLSRARERIRGQGDERKKNIIHDSNDVL